VPDDSKEDTSKTPLSLTRDLKIMIIWS